MRPPQSESPTRHVVGLGSARVSSATRGPACVHPGSFGPGCIRIADGERGECRDGGGERLAPDPPLRHRCRSPLPLRPDHSARRPRGSEPGRPVDFLRGAPAGRGQEAGGGNDLRRRGRTGLRQHRLRLGEVLSSGLPAASAPARSGPDRPARHRALPGRRLPPTAAGDGPGGDRDGLLCEPARWALPRVHLGRVRGRHRGGPKRPRGGADHPLRRLVRDAAGAGVLDPLSVKPALDGALLRLSGGRPVLADDLHLGHAGSETELRPQLGLPRPCRLPVRLEGAAVWLERRAALQARPHQAPAHRRSAQWHDRLPARGGDLGA